MQRKLITLILVFALGLVISSCRKTTPTTNDDPTNFLDLKVSESFKFESFSDLQTSIQVLNTKASGVEIVRIYDAHPNNGGRLILTGSVDESGVFDLPIRIASRLEEVYVARLSSVGANEYVAVPVSGNKIQFNFGSSSKDTDVVDPCDNTLVDNFNSNLTIPAGETWCVAAGRYATIKKLQIGTGGTLRVSGTANITKNYQQDGPDQNITVEVGGNLTLPKYALAYTVNNYGTINITGNGDGQLKGVFNNYGTVDCTIKLQNQGDLYNHGTFVTHEEFTNNSDGEFINYCSFYVVDQVNTKSGNDYDFKQNSYFVNNGYVKIDGKLEITGSGNKKTELGSGSLIECEDFKIEGDIEGPSDSNAQIKADDKGDVEGGADLRRFDLCSDDDDYNGNATYVDMTYCTNNVPAPSCDANEPPTITSSLQIGGLVNQAITPYVFTATGSTPITYTVGNLPAGLSFNSTNNTITGTPQASGTYNISLTAQNYMGIDEQTLVLIVTQPTAPPVITSALTDQTTVDEPYSYLLTASGTGNITYNATNLPAGLSFDPATQLITGSPTTAGTYNINLSASNAGGTTNEILVLTVGTPPEITNGLTASGTAGVQFSVFTVTATGSPTITYTASNLPQGLSFDPANQTINGTPLFSGVTNVLLTANNGYGTDSKTLVITINEGLQPPEITSLLTANAMENYPFSYTITADGSQPMLFDAGNLPEGLSFDGTTISGIPTTAGTYNIPIGAQNAAGVDSKILVLTVATGGDTDTDGDGIPDNIDQYPLDPTRAFNSFYPNETDFASLAFEDLWPAYGDYDFNDFVVNINYKIVTNAQNSVVDVIAQYQIMADGASLNNGFGIVFDVVPSTVESVTGYMKLGNAVILAPEGYEAGHTAQTVVIPFDAINPIMDGGMANTIPGGKYVQTVINTVTTHFGTPQASIGTPPFNPFIFVDQERGHEVHLKDQPPTEFVDEDYFGTDSDASDPAAGIYYRSTSGLPWGIETPINFNYPIETADILTAHLKFAAWAQSGGVDFEDWYMDEPGYRNEANIYVIP